MAKNSAEAVAPNLETITSNRLAIERGSLIAGNISFQIRNIATLLVDDVPSNFSFGPFVAAGVVTGGIFAVMSQSVGGFFLGAIIGVGVTAFLMKDSFATEYQLQLLTNAATSFRLVNSDKAFLLKLKSTIEDAMHSPDNSMNYFIDMSEQKIERIEANTTHVIHSPGAAVIGGSASQTSQSTNVVVQGLQDITELLSIVERSAIANKDALSSNLEIIRGHLAGGARTRDEAKAAWAKFVEHAGVIATAGNNVWELIARTAKLVS